MAKSAPRSMPFAPPELSQPPKGNLWLMVGGPLFSLGAELYIQKYGSAIPDLVVWGCFAIGFVCMLVGVFRVERFLKQSGQIWSKFREHPISSIMVMLLMVFTLRVNVKTLYGRLQEGRLAIHASIPSQVVPAVAKEAVPVGGDSYIPSPIVSQKQRAEDAAIARQLVLNYRSAHPVDLKKSDEVNWVNTELRRRGRSFVVTRITETHKDLRLKPFAADRPTGNLSGIVGPREDISLDNVQVYGFPTGIDLSNSAKAEIKNSTVCAAGAVCGSPSGEKK